MSEEAKPAKERSPRRKKKPLLRFLRILLVPILCVAALFAGLVIGYVYVGKEPLSEVWSIETWRHLFDLMFKDT
ncbi:DNA-directed RNA polymerase subunit beta [Paenibacillus sp. J2TS4]|uniref:DNA-directed RNA polymerase subunit beta n=1 Tax=Paenibacillus sp. J2TS4 TaxID=2807194 RepID=UPI001B2897AB|nr:DNA-directed RNA polymerase subunit beta [Paenibacillus sp. J2TS4]GIP35574.1 hypothetical protein J2TS4_47840 [Paenibacillus sp. J2TS4]